MLFGTQRQAEHFQDRGIEIGADDRDVAGRSPFTVAGPVHNQRDADAPFVQPTFPAAEGKIGCGKRNIKLGSGDHAVGAAEIRGGHATVIGKENDDGAVIQSNSSSLRRTRPRLSSMLSTIAAN